jgi:hypothetical protein
MVNEQLNKNKQIDTGELSKEAMGSEHKEAYKTLDRTEKYRIGVGARITAPETPSFFSEILIYLFPSPNKIDLASLEKSLICLKKLEVMNYSLTAQDGNCISCEKTVTAQDLATEYSRAKSLMTAVFTK